MRPDGEIVAYDYDPNEHQLVALTTDRGTITYRYDEPTDQLAQIVDPDGEALTLTYDGPLPVEVAWSGTISGTVGVTHDSDLRPATVTVNDGNPIAYGYDDDGLVIAAGPMTITREPATGREATTTLGGVTTMRTYTSFGEPDVYTVLYDGAPIYVEDLDYDARGWITRIARTQSGSTAVWHYAYDARGRLATVVRDGAPFASYSYDANSNRINYDGPFGTITPNQVDVDDRDRLRQYGDRTFTYTDSGDLATQTQGAATVTYDYDAFDGLRRVELPSGVVIDYVIDGARRRIGKKVGGVLVQGWLYQDRLNPIAELDGSGSVTARFVYGTRADAPDAMVKDDATYRIVADHLGSPRLVVVAATRTVAQALRYDALAVL